MHLKNVFCSVHFKNELILFDDIYEYY